MAERILISGLNWLGDGIMSMPALQRFREQHPDAYIAQLLKPRVRMLWSMHPVPDAIIDMPSGLAASWQTARAIREGAFDSAYVLPNSFRSAVVPLIGGVRRRIGVRGHRLPGIINVELSGTAAADRHQSLEYAHILGVEGVEPLPPPQLQVPVIPAAELESRFGIAVGEPLVAIVPGAARGPSKQWPESHFAAAGRQLQEAVGGRCVVLGTSGEADLAQRVAGAIGGGAFSLAGQTGLPELAFLFQSARAVLTNDSGGMHLAAATGTAVVGVFGISNPAQTGALGDRVAYVYDEDTERARDVPRESEEARRALEAISPERVVAAAHGLLASDG